MRRNVEEEVKFPLRVDLVQVSKRLVGGIKDEEILSGKGNPEANAYFNALRSATLDYINDQVSNHGSSISKVCAECVKHIKELVADGGDYFSATAVMDAIKAFPDVCERLKKEDEWFKTFVTNYSIAADKSISSIYVDSVRLFDDQGAPVNPGCMKKPNSNDNAAMLIPAVSPILGIVDTNAQISAKKDPESSAMQNILRTFAQYRTGILQSEGLNARDNIQAMKLSEEQTDLLVKFTAKANAIVAARTDAIRAGIYNIVTRQGDKSVNARELLSNVDEYLKLTLGSTYNRLQQEASKHGLNTVADLLLSNIIPNVPITSIDQRIDSDKSLSKQQGQTLKLLMVLKSKFDPENLDKSFSAILKQTPPAELQTELYKRMNEDNMRVLKTFTDGFYNGFYNAMTTQLMESNRGLSGALQRMKSGSGSRSRAPSLSEDSEGVGKRRDSVAPGLAKQGSSGGRGRASSRGLQPSTDNPAVTRKSTSGNSNPVSPRDSRRESRAIIDASPAPVVQDKQEFYQQVGSVFDGRSTLAFMVRQLEDIADMRVFSSPVNKAFVKSLTDELNSFIATPLTLNNKAINNNEIILSMMKPSELKVKVQELFETCMNKVNEASLQDNISFQLATRKWGIADPANDVSFVRGLFDNTNQSFVSPVFKLAMLQRITLQIPLEIKNLPEIRDQIADLRAGLNQGVRGRREVNVENTGTAAMLKSMTGSVEAARSAASGAAAVNAAVAPAARVRPSPPPKPPQRPQVPAADEGPQRQPAVRTPSPIGSSSGTDEDTQQRKLGK